MSRIASSAQGAVAMIPDGVSLMIGGFLGVGSPHRSIAAAAGAGMSPSR
jgi:acetate CoA/acetoacetate CoA-transferase alpha subunit